MPVIDIREGYIKRANPVVNVTKYSIPCQQYCISKVCSLVHQSLTSSFWCAIYLYLYASKVSKL